MQAKIAFFVSNRGVARNLFWEGGIKVLGVDKTVE